jgi:alpha-tubulin suppressor-like RCC1 family protein
VQGRRPSRLHVLFERWVLQEVAAITAAASSSLALMKDGTVWARGNNANGQLGYGIMTLTNTPVNVCAVGATPPCSIAKGNALQGVSAIAAGGNHAFALTNNTVLAWGENLADQLGDGTSDTRLTPVNVCSAGATAPCSIAYGNVLQGLSGIVAGEGSTGDRGFGRFLELFVTVTRRDEPVLPLQLRFVRSIVVTGESFY